MFSRKVVIRGLIAVAALVPTAFAQVDQTATASVSGDTTLAAAGTNAAISFTLAAGGATVTDNSTVLDYASNDGLSHAITAVAVADEMGDVWTYTGTGAAATATFPKLSYKSALVSSTDTNGGSPGLSAVVLANADNTAGATADVVSGIKNASGTVTVTLEAVTTQEVAAGSYTATVQFAIVQK